MTEEQAGPSGFKMEDGDEGVDVSLPQMTFSTLVLSLSTSAMVHLGVSPGPQATDPPEVSLPLARQTIDILKMLVEKTQGNLEPQEEALLESVMHEVRMKYVEARKQQK
ncbi:MAG: DUF1844 domain-containing protein [Myxococcota bacterium]